MSVSHVPLSHRTTPVIFAHVHAMGHRKHSGLVVETKRCGQEVYEIHKSDGRKAWVSAQALHSIEEVSEAETVPWVAPGEPQPAEWVRVEEPLKWMSSLGNRADHWYRPGDVSEVFCSPGDVTKPPVIESQKFPPPRKGMTVKVLDGSSWCVCHVQKTQDPERFGVLMEQEQPEGAEYTVVQTSQWTPNHLEVIGDDIPF